MFKENVNETLDELKGSLVEERPIDLSDAEGLQKLVRMLQDKKHKIGIEFECEDCCKKVLNGSQFFVVKDFAVLLPALGDCLFLKVFSGGKLVDKQIMRAIIIPVSHICAIEIEPVQVDP